MDVSLPLLLLELLLELFLELFVLFPFCLGAGSVGGLLFLPPLFPSPPPPHPMHPSRSWNPTHLFPKSFPIHLCPIHLSIHLFPKSLPIHLFPKSFPIHLFPKSSLQAACPGGVAFGASLCWKLSPCQVSCQPCFCYHLLQGVSYSSSTSSWANLWSVFCQATIHHPLVARVGPVLEELVFPASLFQVVKHRRPFFKG